MKIIIAALAVAGCAAWGQDGQFTLPEGTKPGKITAIYSFELAPKNLKCGPLQHVEYPYCNVNPVECKPKCAEGIRLEDFAWPIENNMDEVTHYTADYLPLYESKTISMQLVAAEGDRTSIYLTEHSDADFVWGEAFYWTTFEGQDLLLHKEFATPVTKGSVWGTSVDIPLWKIAFIRIKELNQRTETEFGRKPREPR